ncbi:TetR family transcriptional regulator [Bifidobacterium sp. ESL0732]|uniref:TetR/AcrR family transcriptional regulator n=1 Tax=Bifidobacterium sp. ESL0732 TaxID=2983222 RepID=UPI0023F6A3A3|nr:TetR family transcriptional regulator [Bifidobacterium sp. ESL0732]WEV63655.1 TetR family transcriptional regulator [Bifidobacterium sp. ESL0732]
MARKAETAKTGTNRGTLNRETLLKNALAIVDEDGLDALSLRALGKRIGVSYTALYRHLPDKNALLDGIAEQIWRETLSGLEDSNPDTKRDTTTHTASKTESKKTPDTADTAIDRDWKSHVKRYAMKLHATLLKHPNAAILVATHPIDTLEQYQLLAAAIKPFMTVLAGKNPPDDLVGLIQGATILTTGYVLAEAVAPFGDTGRSTPDPSDATRDEAMRQFPELAKLLAPLADTSTPWRMKDEYQKALDALIDGWGPGTSK